LALDLGSGPGGAVVVCGEEAADGFEGVAAGGSSCCLFDGPEAEGVAVVGFVEDGFEVGGGDFGHVEDQPRHRGRRDVVAQAAVLRVQRGAEAVDSTRVCGFQPGH